MCARLISASSIFAGVNLYIDEAEMSLAHRLYLQDRYPQCIRVIDEITANDDFKISPYYPDARYYRGMSFYQQRDFTVARDEFTTVVRMSKRNKVYPLALYYLGMTYYWLEETDRARSLFSRYTNEFPHSMYVDNCYYWIAECYLLDQNIENALEYFGYVTNYFPEGNKVGWANYRILQIMGVSPAISGPTVDPELEARLQNLIALNEMLEKYWRSGISANERKLQMLMEYESDLRDAADWIETQSVTNVTVPANQFDGNYPDPSDYFNNPDDLTDPVDAASDETPADTQSSDQQTDDSAQPDSAAPSDGQTDTTVPDDNQTDSGEADNTGAYIFPYVEERYAILKNEDIVSIYS